MLSNIKSIVSGIVLIVGFILLYNAYLWLSQGNPTLPMLKDKYWVGYYAFENENKTWFLSYFFEHDDALKMVVITNSSLSKELGLSNTDHIDFYTVDRNSYNENYISYEFILEDQIPLFKGEQLYKDRRYFFGPLLAGEFKNIMRMNNNIDIRGESIFQDDRKVIFEMGLDVPESKIIETIDNFIIEENFIENMEDLQAFLEEQIIDYKLQKSIESWQ